MGKQLHVEHAPVNEGTGVDQDKVVADVTRDFRPCHSRDQGNATHEAAADRGLGRFACSLESARLKCHMPIRLKPAHPTLLLRNRSLVTRRANAGLVEEPSSSSPETLSLIQFPAVSGKRLRACDSGARANSGSSQIPTSQLRDVR